MQYYDDFDDLLPHAPKIYDWTLGDFCYSEKELIPKGAIIHYFSAIYANPDLWYHPTICRELFTDLNLPVGLRSREWKVNLGISRNWASAHYLIDRDGIMYSLVPEHKIAWHAGRSVLNGRAHCNNYTVGIELIAAPQVDESLTFTDVQYRSAAWLCRKFQPKWIAGHDTVRENYMIKYKSGTPKFDPGPTFNWDRFYELRRLFIKEK